MKPMMMAASALLAVLTSTGAIAHTQAKRPQNAQQAAVKPAHPEPRFNGRSTGQEALRRLQTSRALPQFARHYGMTEDQVRGLLQTDRSAFLDNRGRLHFVEPKAIGGVTEQVGSNTNQTNIALDQTFLLESKPGSPRTIYLDFNGHTASGTAWNNSYGLTSISSPAFDLDGTPGSFSSTELQTIQGIWRRVAEDYAPFDVNVTTRANAEDTLTRATSSDTQFGIRVVITKDFTRNTTSPCNCGGFAYVGAFDNVGDFYKPAYVFHDNLANNEKYIAEAVSHEAGHTVGLLHDGTSTTGYYQGHGTGTTGWAPIMGVGYYKNLVQWSKGDYANANQKQDDYLVMQQNSLFFDADEAGNTIATALPLTQTTLNGLANFQTQATLQGPADTDVFEISAGLGVLTLTGTPQRTSPNADLVLTLMDSTGQVLAQNNPLDLLSATLSFSVQTAGKYYVSVRGTGNGDPFTTGYTDYGSVGTYTLVATAALPSTGNQVPNALIATSSNLTGNVPLTINLSGASSTDDGSIAAYQWNFGDGTVASGVSTSKTYNTAGNYTITLTVTDNAGLTDQDTVSVSAQQPVATPLMSVKLIQMTGFKKSRQFYAVASVVVVDQNGLSIPNATVTGEWSNRVSATANVLTNTSGVAKFTSPRATTGGTFVFTVKNIQAGAYQYDASKNTVTSNSITF
jgi:PKD repeat protein